MKPLQNVKILDLTRVLAGPYATMLMQELGAEVIKVEMPVTGDDARYFGPFKEGKSAYFISINRGKKSISLNLKKEKSKEIIFELVKKVDIVTENFRPGTMEKLGLDYETLKKHNPKIIFASTSGFGQTGPDSKKPAYDMLVQAMSGMMSITGWPDKPPTRVGMSIGDIGSGLYTVIGILSALYQRSITGEGQRIDVAMLDCQLSLLENAIVRHSVSGKSPTPNGNQHPTITPFQVFKTKDSYLALAMGNNVMWKKFCEVIGRDDLLENPNFSDNLKRTEFKEELLPEIINILETNTSTEWTEIFEKAKLPYSPVYSIGEIMQHPQVKARNMVVETSDNLGGTIQVAGNPIKMTNIEETNIREAAPEIGEHNYEIFKEMLDFSDEEIEKL
ncbi:MAG: CoA transferase, partial [Bacteroidales bacterium]|nr:CoA transferase [Bacteroidales bacterium]